MKTLKSQQGSVFVFVTLLIVLLLAMVGMGLDTGWITYLRSQSQPAVDAAALAGTSGLVEGTTEVENRVAAYNSTNVYLHSDNNVIGADNITYIRYDEPTQTLTKVDPASANGVRVALEDSNPYGATNPPSSLISRLFLLPVLNLFGANINPTVNVDVSAVAYLKNIPDFPVALKGCEEGLDKYLIWSPATTETACWTTYTRDPANKPTIEQMVDNSKCNNIPAVSYDTPIYLNNGTIANILNAIEAAHGPIGDPNNKPCFIVPVTADSEHCNQISPITEWAEICLTGLQNGGSPLEMPDGSLSNHWIKADITCDYDLANKSPSSCSVPVLVRDQLSGM